MSFNNNQFLINLLNMNNSLINSEENFDDFFRILRNEENNSNKNGNKIIFITNYKRKRGKQAYKNQDKNHIHGKDSFDNLQRKIQVHFLTF